MNKELALKITVAHLYMQTHKISPEQFVALDDEIGILEYVDASFEWLYLTGEQGIVRDIDKYVKSRMNDGG